MRLIKLKKRASISVVAWTVFILAVAGFSFFQEYRTSLTLAKEAVFISYANDITYRKWAAGHGGLYVPLTQETPANPYLDIDHKVITRDDGKQFTLMNPAYMTRQVIAKRQVEFGLYAKLSSLNPINPINAPDPWEQEKLPLLTSRDSEFYEITQVNDQDNMRYIRAFITEESCLACHAKQGYRVGDVRGSLSVSIPMKPYWRSLGRQTAYIGLVFFIVWSAGLLFIRYNYNVLESEIDKNISLECNILESSNKYKVIFDGASEGIVLHDLDGKVLEANKYFLDMSGYTLKELKALNHELLVHPEERPSFVDEFKSLRGGKSIICEHLLLRKDGETIPIEVSGTLIGGQYIQGLIRNISTRKENELLKEEIERIMRHDIKSPLNAIIGIPQLIEADQNLTEEQRENISIIKRSGYRILGQIESSLNLYKIENNSFEFSPSKFNLFTIIDEILSEFKHITKEKHLILQGNFAQHQKTYIFADESLCFSILANAVKNAIEAAPFNSKISISIDIGDEIKITIHNEGIVAHQIMERFFNKYSTYGKSAGTGLGTYIIKRFTQAQGGRVLLQSNQDEGTVLEIFLPKTSRNLSEK